MQYEIKYFSYIIHSFHENKRLTVIYFFEGLVGDLVKKENKLFTIQNRPV